jgi:ActR/RegA family two-component response regulator
MLSRKIPESCHNVDLDAVGRELIRSGGNVSAAARALGLHTRDLRLFL